MSWWDYGYQITAMANRTILVDNNTWNNTHISRVGQVNERLITKEDSLWYATTTPLITVFINRENDVMKYNRSIPVVIFNDVVIFTKMVIL